ncbi:MAG: hypothetical protein ACLR5Y_00240 [Haemophilus parainfluenzae]
MAALYTIAVLIIQPYWLFVEIGFFAMLLLMALLSRYIFFSHGK